MAVCFQCTAHHDRSRRDLATRSDFSRKSRYFKLFVSHLLFMFLGYLLSINSLYVPVKTASRLMSSASRSVMSSKEPDKSQSSTCSISETPYSVAFVTIGNQDQASILAEKLVSNKLAGCVNISPKITSIYEWKGKLERDEESLMMIKTKTSLVPRLIDFVKANHPYEVCEVISLPVQHGNPDYLKWLGDCLRKDEG